MKRSTGWARHKWKLLGIPAAALIVAGTAWLYSGAAGGGAGERQTAALQSTAPAASASPQPSPDGAGGAGSQTAPPPTGAPEDDSSSGGRGEADAQPGTGTGADAGASADASPSPSPAKTAAPQATAKPGAAGAAGDKPAATPPAGGAKPGGGKAGPSEKPQPKEKTVQLSIVGPEDTGTILDSAKVEIGEDSTVMDALKKATRSGKIQLEFKGTGAAAYVVGIDNIYEFDNGPGSGWLFSVNGEFPKKSAGSYALKPGDEVRWMYTLDYGDDLGAPDASGTQGGG
ncbi:DUF4430 domain-containing protein [Paenibacillus pasadenensis]|uniref:DUF4430 domain-containing protein n=1 Tax=Paenibacillus pasadenensis TaxID=217090 RepID=UPI0020413202|nr:DUF4430 domain-containing protein [Paenibacillus pasadenensis]MCM3750250.1 DUF4430 domain-containing protein [Paenibacillus pasadenensis]